MNKWLDRYESGGLVSKNSLNRNVTCSNCGWSWKLSDGGLDPMTCHKCGGDIKMKHGGELDEYKDKGQVNFKDQLYQQNRPVVDNTAAPIVLPGNLFYDKTRVVNSSSAGLNKFQLKEINQNLKNNAFREKQAEIENYKAAELFHNNNPVAKLLGTRSAPASNIKPTAKELAYGAGAGINEFYDVPGIGIANDFVNPLSLVSKGIISPWMQAPLQAQQSDSYLPYAGAALSTALTYPMVRPASIAAKTILNPANIYRGALGAGKYLTEETALKNAYKLNPWAFKPYANAYYHRSPNLENIVNKETGMLQGYGQSEAGKAYSELARPGKGPEVVKQAGSANEYVSTINLKKPANTQLYFAKGTPLDWGRTNMILDKKTGKLIPGQGYAGPYMVEVKDVPMGSSTKGRLPGAEPIGVGSYAVSKRPISLDETNFYKEHWLQRYKKIHKPKIFSEGQPYEGAPHIYEDMVPINGRYQPRTVITDAGVKNEILGLEATPIIPLNQIEYPVTPNKFLYGPHSSFGKMEKGVVTDTYRGMPPGSTNTYTSTLPSYTSSVKPFVFNQKRFNEAKGFLDRYQHLKKLQAKKLIAKDADILKYARSEEGVNDITRRAIEKTNTKYRGVYPDLNKYATTGEQYSSGVKITEDILKSTTEAMKNAGVDITNPVAVGEYMSTHIPLNKFGYRSGVNSYGMPDDWDVLFTSELPSTMYGSHQYKMKLPFNFEQGNYKEWYSTFIKNNAKKGINELDRNTKPSDWINGNIPYQSELYPGMPYFGGNTGVYAGPKGFKIFDSGQFLSEEEVKKILNQGLLLPKKFGGPIVTNRGQWDYPGQTTIIPSNNITMQGVPYPVVGVDNTGHTKMMQPGMNYTFPGQYVTEYPMMKPGGQLPTIYVTDPNDKGLQMYKDSSALYHSYLRNLDRLKQLGLPVTQTDDKPSTLDYRARFNKHLLSFPQIRKKAKEKGIILEKHMYEQGVLQPYLVQGKDVFDNLVNKSLKTPKADTLRTHEAAHKTIKPVGLDKVFPPSVIEDTYDGTRRKKREWVTDASGNIINDTGFQEEGKNVNFKSRIIENTPLFTQRYAEPVQPVELQSKTSQSMQSLHPQRMQSSPISMQGQPMQIQPMTLPQQKGRPVYGPGSTIIGYSNDNMKFNPAYQYTGAPNNQFNLQDKELLNNPELLKQYIYNQDSGYHYKDGGEMIKRADGSYSKRGLWDNIRDNIGSGKAPTKQMLDQEKKIRNQYKDGGEKDKFNTNLKGNAIEGFKYHSELFPSLLNDAFDYDTKGFYKQIYDEYNGDLDAITKALTPNSPTQHIGTDRYKKPNHPTFSNESKYSIPIIRPGGKWGHNEEENYDYFKATRRNIKNMNNSDGSPFNYFKRAEDYNQDGIPDVKLFFRNEPVFKQGGGVILNTGGEQHRIYVKSTNRGEGDKGHIMVNHPTMDKGMWDTIDLTQKAGAKTIAQGVDATKEWHRENPYMKQRGGERNNNLKNINLNLPVIRYQEMNPLHINGFLANDRNQNLFIGGINPRYQNEDFSVGPYMIGVGNKYFQKFPADMGMSGTYHVNNNFDINMGAGQNNINAGIKYNFANGGYVVRRSHDRKGKTHVVTGPDGTKKYFGDPNMGERGNSKYGKEAFYARHKSNLAKNPYFRAYARATWEEGGETMAIGGQTMMNPVTRKDNRNWLEFLKN